MSGSKNALPITQGALFPQIIRFAIPLALSGILQLLFNAADIIVVGKFAGSNSLAAVGATSALISLIVSLFLGVSVGVNIVVARMIGSGDDAGLSKAVPTSMILSVILGLFVMVIGLLFSVPMLLLMQTPEELVSLASIYLRIYFLGIPGSLVYNFGAAILRARGDTKRPLYFLAVSGVLNVILNLVLVIVFRLDVAGVAIATTVSQYVSMTLVVIALTKENDAGRLDFSHLCFDLPSALRMIQVGIPAGLQSTIFDISNVLIQSSINSFGTAAIAANTAAGNINGFLWLGTNAVYHAALTFSSQNLGANKLDRVKKSFWACLAAVSIIGVSTSILSYVFARPLLSIYISASDGSYEQIMEFGMIKILYCCVPQVLCGIMDTVCGMVRGLGKTWLPMFVSVFGACGLRIVWIYTVFAHHHALSTLYLSYPVTWTVTAIMHIFCFFYFYKKLEQKRTSEK